MPVRPTTAALTGGALLAATLVLGRILRPPNVRITDPEGRPTIDGTRTARSVQAAELTIDDQALEAIWSPAGLDRIGRTYWRFLARISLGTIRVVETPAASLVVFLARPVVLLAFDPPDFLLDSDRGLIRWQIRGGLLAAREASDTANHPTPGTARGLFCVELRRLGRSPAGQAIVRLEVAVTDFHPTVARLLGPAVYTATQARIHVAVTHAFMRSLARMRLASRAAPASAGRAPRETD